MPASALQKAQAIDVIYDFEQEPRECGWFTKVKRKDVAEGLRTRVLNPDSIDTSKLNLCGPAAVIRAVCEDNPVRYARFACQLFDTGRASLGTLEVHPSVNLRVANPTFTDKINAADWIVLAGIRDSENYLTDFATTDAGFAGITLPGAVKDWFLAAGYTDVIEECNVWFTKDEEDGMRASYLRDQGYRVALFINAQMLYESTQNDWSSIPTHWVLLTSPIVFGDDHVWFSCFTWGNGHYYVPQGGILTIDGFENNFYGFVAAKP